jgi:hypothetical protein
MNEINEVVCAECNNFIPFRFAGNIIGSNCECKANPIYTKSHITGKTFKDYQLCCLINTDGHCKQFEARQIKPSWVDAIKHIIPYQKRTP